MPRAPGLRALESGQGLEGTERMVHADWAGALRALAVIVEPPDSREEDTRCRVVLIGAGLAIENRPAGHHCADGEQVCNLCARELSLCFIIRCVMCRLSISFGFTAWQVFRQLIGQLAKLIIFNLKFGGHNARLGEMARRPCRVERAFGSPRRGSDSMHIHTMLARWDRGGAILPPLDTVATCERSCDIASCLARAGRSCSCFTV